jgi:hypothetical protein
MITTHETRTQRWKDNIKTDLGENVVLGCGLVTSSSGFRHLVFKSSLPCSQKPLVGQIPASSIQSTPSRAILLRLCECVCILPSTSRSPRWPFSLKLVSFVFAFVLHALSISSCRIIFRNEYRLYVIFCFLLFLPLSLVQIFSSVALVIKHGQSVLLRQGKRSGFTPAQETDGNVVACFISVRARGGLLQHFICRKDL